MPESASSRAAGPGGADAWLPGLGLRAAHLAALWAFAFVQPLFDLLGKNPDFFVARGNDRADILIFAFALVLVPPLLLIAAERLLELVSRQGAGTLHLSFVAVLVAAFLLGAVNESTVLPAGAMVALALTAGAGLALAYRRLEAVRSLLSFLIPAPVVFLVVFLLFSDSAELVDPPPEIASHAVETESDAPLVLVVFDELPAATLMDSEGTLDAARFPNFARLARTSTWHRRAVSSADRTAQAVPAILTGTEPEGGLTPTAADHPDNLFTLFGGARPVNAWESVAELCPTSVCNRSAEPLPDRLHALASDLRVVSERLLLPEPLAGGLPPIDQAYLGFGDGGSPDGEGLDAERLEGLRTELASSDGERSINFVHFDVPHVPWHRLPDGRSCQSETWDAAQMIDDGDSWIPDRRATRWALAAHLLQAGYADRMLGGVIDAMKAAGIWQRAALVVVADHGIVFDPGAPHRTLSSSNAGATVRVPLFVKAPGQRSGRVSDRRVRTVDVLPTIAELLGTRLPFAVDGAPVGQAPRSGEVAAYAEVPDEVRRVDAARVERQRAALTARKEKLLGARDSMSRLFEIGPRPDLIGSEPDTERVGAGSYELVAADSYESVEPEAEVPCQLVAKLDGVGAEQPLAVVVNGEVAATTTSYESATGAIQAFALIDPRAFRAGDNEVSLWRIAGERPRARLAALARG